MKIWKEQLQKIVLVRIQMNENYFMEHMVMQSKESSTKDMMTDIFLQLVHGVCYK